MRRAELFVDPYWSVMPRKLPKPKELLRLLEDRTQRKQLKKAINDIRIVRIFDERPGIVSGRLPSAALRTVGVTRREFDELKAILRRTRLPKYPPWLRGPRSPHAALQELAEAVDKWMTWSDAALKLFGLQKGFSSSEVKRLKKYMDEVTRAQTKLAAAARSIRQKHS